MKYVLIGFLLALVVVFASGYYFGLQGSTPTTITKTDENKMTDKKVNEVTTTTRVKKPDGTVTTVRTTSENETVSTKDTTQSSVVQTQPKHSTLSISALVALNPATGLQPIYGISATKEVLAPVTLGVFGLTNGTLGASIGVNF